MSAYASVLNGSLLCGSGGTTVWMHCILPTHLGQTARLRVSVHTGLPLRVTALVMRWNTVSAVDGDVNIQSTRLSANVIGRMARL